MSYHIDPKSPTPLYEQIAVQIRLRIASGALPGGTTLPSVRNLSAELRISVATVVQAYRTLETDGLVERRQGSGTYVRRVAKEQRDAVRQANAQQLVASSLAEAAHQGVPAGDTRRVLDDMMNAE